MVQSVKAGRPEFGCTNMFYGNYFSGRSLYSFIYYAEATT